MRAVKKADKLGLVREAPIPVPEERLGPRVQAVLYIIESILPCLLHAGYAQIRVRRRSDGPGCLGILRPGKVRELIGYCPISINIEPGG